MDATRIPQIINGWPQEPRDTGQLVVDAHGAPDEAIDTLSDEAIDTLSDVGIEREAAEGGQR